MQFWGEPTRVLIADDSDVQVRLLTRVLTAEGYRCLAAPNGGALLDVEMPGDDGLTTCRRLKNAPETHLMPVLIMTGNVEPDTHLHALEAGADDFLPKPLSL